LSPLKSREYLASGLPLFFAYEDSLLTPDLPFVKIFPNDPSPINIEEVVDFVSSCRADPELPEKERRFAKEHFDWEIIMKQILDFTGGIRGNQNGMAFQKKYAGNPKYRKKEVPNRELYVPFRELSGFLK